MTSRYKGIVKSVPSLLFDTTFKYGVTVSESSPEIRSAFIRKVYTILRAFDLFQSRYIIYTPSASMPDCEAVPSLQLVRSHLFPRLPLPLLVD